MCFLFQHIRGFAKDQIPVGPQDQLTSTSTGSASAGPMFDTSYSQAGVILEGNLGEKVSQSWLTSPYRELREK